MKYPMMYRCVSRLLTFLLPIVLIGLCGCSVAWKLKKADEAFKGENFIEAEERYGKLSDKYPGDLAMRYWTAVSEFKQKKYVEAMKNCQKNLDATPDHLLTMALKAEIFLEAGQVAEGQMVLESILVKHPEDVKSYLRLAQIYQKKEQADRAAAIMEDADAHGVNDPNIYAKLFQLYEQDIKDERLAYYYLKRYSETATTRVGLSDIIYDLKKREKENDALKQFYVDRKYITNARRRMTVKDYQGADALLQKVTIRDATWHRMSGLIQLLLGYPFLAQKELDTALRMSPKNAETNYLLGRAYWRLGDNDLAVQYWRQALALDPYHQRARQALEQGFPPEEMEAAPKEQQLE